MFDVADWLFLRVTISLAKVKCAVIAAACSGRASKANAVPHFDHFIKVVYLCLTKLVLQSACYV